MDEQTHKALIASIEKWERNAEAETVLEYTLGTASCALCQLFWNNGCKDCPVRQATGCSGCGGSPYIAAVDALEDWELAFEEGRRTKRLRNKAHAAARKEVDFLKSLLPEGADNA